MAFQMKSGMNIDHHDQLRILSNFKAKSMEKIRRELYTTNLDMLKSWKKERKLMSALP